MIGNEPGKLEHKVADSYIISVRREEESASAVVSAEERQLYETLQQRILQLQKEYGAEKLSVVRAFELIPAELIPLVAAVIRENAVIEALRQDGYLVEQQGIMRAQNYDVKEPRQT